MFCFPGATFSTLPWSRSDHAIWVTDALWYSSLICAISAIITSIQTKSILDDLPTKDHLESGTLSDKDVQRMRRAILRYKKTPGIKHWVMLFIWQFPSMTAAYAWCCYLCGLTLYLCTPFIRRLAFEDRHKVKYRAAKAFAIPHPAFLSNSKADFDRLPPGCTHLFRHLRLRYPVRVLWRKRPSVFCS
jgi:hypothetical protein